jgi:hypothetical protein
MRKNFSEKKLHGNYAEEFQRVKKCTEILRTNFSVKKLHENFADEFQREKIARKFRRRISA